MKYKVMTIFGTRPEAIKMAPLVKALKESEKIEVVVCVTAQHRQMLDQVLDCFNIKPDIDLNIMKKGQTLTQITTRVLEALEEVIRVTKPDLILVHGDTTTTYAGALAAFYNQIKIGHVEAGLRTYNKYSPFPEEMNRQMVSVLADYNFAPTEDSKNNLIKEGRREDRIFVTGNTAIDALKTTVSDNFKHPIFEWLGNSKLILLTVHRRENIGNPMKSIFLSIKEIVEKHEDVKVVFPVHLNPIIKEIANSTLEGINRIKMIEPLDVIDFHNFMAKSYIILTDSGGVQEEAPSLGKPVLVLRDTTERPEGIQAGTLKLVGTKQEDITNMVDKLLTDDKFYESMSKAKNPYGNGTASSQITKIIEELINDKK